MEIRLANRNDLKSITQIYNQGIEDRIATLESCLKTDEQMLSWWEAHGERYPVWVILPAHSRSSSEQEIMGYACLNQFNSRCCYDKVADFSIYVERSHRGKGLGAALMTALEEKSRELGYHKLVLSTLGHNAPAIGLYSKMGFRLVGTYHEQGVLDNRYVDVTLMEKILVSPTLSSKL